jgi:hypothetical protein
MQPKGLLGIAAFHNDRESVCVKPVLFFENAEHALDGKTVKRYRVEIQRRVTT